jgi:hypothetical protein
MTRSYERIAQGIAEELDGDATVIFVIVQRGPGVRGARQLPSATIDADCKDAPQTLRAVS